MPVYYFPSTGGGGGGGWIIVNDALPAAGDAVSNKVYQDSHNTVLQSVTASSPSISVVVKASSPLVVVGGVTATLDRSPTLGFYSGTVSITASGVVKCSVLMSNGAVWTTESFTVYINTPPALTSLYFIGGYPGAQTELKAGDVVQVAGTTDKVASKLLVYNSGAGISQAVSFTPGTSFTASVTVADRGNVAQLIGLSASAVDAAGATGSGMATDATALVEFINTVNLNNLHPTVAFGSITYPVAAFVQNALKGFESANVAVTDTDYDTILFTSPNSDVSISFPTVGGAKIVSRISGGYNVSTQNLAVSANRTANDATSTAQALVRIADTPPTITVTTPYSRLRGGGNDGTSVQGYTITLTSDEVLLIPPTLDDGGAGTFLGSWAGGPSAWTRTLDISDTDPPGTYSWTNVQTVNEAGVVVNIVSTGPTYTIGGFVARSVTFGPFLQTATLNVVVTDYTKLQAGIFTATNQPSIRMVTQGDTLNFLNGWTVLNTGSSPTTVFWNDQAAASSNSGGTAQLLNVEEVP